MAKAHEGEISHRLPLMCRRHPVPPGRARALGGPSRSRGREGERQRYGAKTSVANENQAQRRQTADPRPRELSNTSNSWQEPLPFGRRRLLPQRAGPFVSPPPPTLQARGSPGG